MTTEITFLGGLGEVGMNMMVFSHEEHRMVVDCGLWFPDAYYPGVHLAHANWGPLLEEGDKLDGIVLTHAHEDHIGALPYLLQVVSAPIYGTRLSMGLVEVKLRKNNMEGAAALNVIQTGERFNIGGLFDIEAFHVCHSIPDAVGYAIRTPAGLIVHSGDFKFDYTPAWGEPRRRVRSRRAGG